MPHKPNDDLKDYGESGIENDQERGKEWKIENDQERGKEWKKKAKKTKEVIHIEFNIDDDEKVQTKNAKDGNTERKVRRKKKTIHYYEFSSEDKSGSKPS